MLNLGLVSFLDVEVSDGPEVIPLPLLVGRCSVALVVDHAEPLLRRLQVVYRHGAHARLADETLRHNVHPGCGRRVSRKPPQHLGRGACKRRDMKMDGCHKGRGTVCHVDYGDDTAEEDCRVGVSGIRGDKERGAYSLLLWGGAQRP